MENIYENILLMNKYKLLPQQLVLENNITLNEDESILKVLTINAKVDVSKTNEIFKGEAQLSGKVITNIVYLNDKEEINNQISVSPFSYSLKNENIDLSSKINCDVNVVGCLVDKIYQNQIKVLTTLNLDNTIITNKDISYLSEPKENIYTKQKETNVVTYEGQSCEKFEETLSTTVKDGASKVLMTNVDYQIKDYNIGNGFVSVEGDFYVKILYVNKNEPKELQTVTIAKEFKQEIEVENLTKDHDIDLFLSVINEDVKVELEDKDDGTTIAVFLTALVCTNKYKSNNILCVSDVYSSESVLNTVLEEHTNSMCNRVQIIEDKIEGNVTLSDQEPRIDKYITTTNVCASVSNSYISDSVLTIEGIINANIIYLNDELGGIQSVEIELPYVMDKKIEDVTDAILETNVCIYDVDVMTKRGREIYFDAKIKAYVNVTTNCKINMVSKIEEISKLQTKTHAIEVYYAKQGQSVWDIAKSLNVAPELITGQNPDMVDPLDKNQNIVLYYQKQRKN